MDEGREAYERAERDALEAERQIFEAAAHAARAEADAPGTSWAAADLGSMIDAGLRIPEPEYLSMTDGTSLIYPEKVHVFFGDSESGKTWAALMACKSVLLEHGRGIMYVDYEDTAVTFIERMRQIGLRDSLIRDRNRVAYIRPDDPWTPEAQEDLAVAGMRVNPALIVLDGVTESMTLEGLNVLSSGDTAEFHHRLAGKWQAVGAAVILIDHVARNSPGDYAFGAQHKRAGIDGASLRFNVTSPIARGKHGKVKLTIAKDRPGFLRQHAADGKALGTLNLPSDEAGNIIASIERPSYSDLVPDRGVVEAVAAWIGENPGHSKRAIRAGVSPHNRDVDDAVDQLALEGRAQNVSKGSKHAWELSPEHA